MKTLSGFLVVFLICLCGYASAGTLYVSTTGTDNPTCSQGSPCATLRHTFSVSAGNDTIFIGSGTFRDLDLNLTRVNLTIIGAGETVTILDGENAVRAFTMVNSTVSIRDLSIVNGFAVGTRGSLQDAAEEATAGGCIVASGSSAFLSRVTLRNCVSSGASSAGPAGCIMSDASRITIADSTLSLCRGGIAAAIYFTGKSVGDISRTTFSNCSTDEGGWGGAIVPEAQTVMNITDSLFIYNYGGYGGAIDDGGDVQWTVKNSTFMYNSALYGGAIYTFGQGSSNFEDCRFMFNTVRNAGGAVRTTSRTIPTFTRCLFHGNVGSSGGAVSVFSERPTTIQDSVFSENTAQSFGGGLDSQYPLLLRNTTFIRNRCSTGTVYLVGIESMTLEDLLFENNIGNLGAGIFIEASEASSRTMRNLKFIGNRARLSGGGIQVSGLSQTSFVDVLCQDNEANTGGCFLAAQNSRIEFVRGVMRGNHATTRGGAGSVGDLVNARLENTLIEYNWATSLGGALMVDGESNMALVSPTIRGNRARVGAGLAFTEVAASCVNASGIQFVNNSAVVAGGAIFFENSRPVCEPNFCSSCTFSQNTAVYGADLTSKPAQIVFVNPPPSTLAPSQRFDAKIVLRDAFGVVVKNVRDYILEVDLKNVTFTSSTPSNASVKGLVSVDVNDVGEASFTLLRIQAAPGTRGLLTFFSFPPTNSLVVPVTVSSCPEGTEAFNQGDYYCLTRIDTTRAVQIVFIVLASVAVFMALVFLIIVIVHKRNTILRKASIPFCILILLGGLTMYSSVYMFLFNTDATCALRPWLLMVGFALCYGSLFIKEWRLFRLFDPNINARVRVRDLDLAKGLSLLIGAELGFLIIWFAVSPFVLDVSTNLTAETITYQCNSKATGALFWVVVAFNGLVLLMGCIIAFLIRNLPDNWNESRYMAFSIYTVTLTIIVCLGICGALYQPNLVSLVASIGIIFSTTATLLGLFIPKFLFVFYKDAMRESLIADIDKLYQDVRWKQHQLHELDSKSRASLTGSATGATQTISSVDSYNPSLVANQGSIQSMAVPSFMSFDNRSMASIQAVASPSVALQPLTNRTGTEDSDGTPKRSKSSVRGKSITSASSRSKTSASSVKRRGQGDDESDSEESEMSSQIISSDEEESPKKKKSKKTSKRSTGASSIPKKDAKPPSSSSSSESDADSSDGDSS